MDNQKNPTHFKIEKYTLNIQFIQEDTVIKLEIIFNYNKNTENTKPVTCT